jgi:hypothetical protein
MAASRRRNARPAREILRPPERKNKKTPETNLMIWQARRFDTREAGHRN